MRSRDQVEVVLTEKEMLLLTALRDKEPFVAAFNIDWKPDRIKGDLIEIEELRGGLTESLASFGFDEDYNPTEAGKLIESIIDKLFVPNLKSTGGK